MPAKLSCFMQTSEQKEDGGGMKKNPDPSKRRGHGKENPRFCYGTLNSRYYRVRQLRDETKSCGNQPANISVIDRR